MNPNNTVILLGKVMDEPRFVSTNNGEEFSCRFVLSVARNYKCSDGTTKADFLPVHLDGKNRMEFAHRIHAGDRIVLNGCMRTDSYIDKKGNRICQIFVEADAISWTLGRNDSVNKSSSENNDLTDEDSNEDLELDISSLPFS